MPNKPDQPEESEEQKALEQKVDAMMDPRSDVSKLAEDFNKNFETAKPEPQKPAPAQAPAPTAPPAPVPVPVVDKSTAPELPKDSGEAIKVNVTPSKAPEPAPEPTPEPAPESSEPVETAQPVANEFDDAVTEQAVDEIVANEGDTVLAVEDAQRASQNEVVVKSGKPKHRFGRLFKGKKAWLIVLIVLIAVFAVPYTRYKVLGLAIKKSVTITVIDNQTLSPISNAEVGLAGATAKTDASGKAHISAGVGDRNLTVNKRYYTDVSEKYFVGFNAKPTEIRMAATGRLVPVTVVNKITGEPVKGVEINVAGTSAKTDSKGQVTIALPTKSKTEDGKLALDGYNTADITVQITDKVVKNNSFAITPAGHIYFLSNKNGTLDVVKANLDGTDRKTVYEGTGREDPNTTSLLASRDWRYLVLKARREGTKTSLNLIDTSTDKITQFENTDADFGLIGWYNHNFVYSITQNNQSYWKPGRQVIKSYQAERQQLNQLDTNIAEGSSTSYAYQDLFNFYLVNNAVVYSTQWYTYKADGTDYNTAGKYDTIRAVQPDGQNKKDYKKFATNTVSYIDASLYAPQSVYFSVHTTADKNSYYEFENQAVSDAKIDQNTFDKSYPTFLLSPSGSQTFWTELRDGKNTLFTGDAGAANKQQIASLSEYAPYGWFRDEYILVSKNSSELYIASPESLKAGHTILKVTDYYKPAQVYSGYGYGYGGL